MMSPARFLAPLLALAFALAPASGRADAEPYFAATTIPPFLLTPPLAPMSAAWNAEVEQIIALQANPDPKEVEQAAAERDMAPEMMVLAVDPALARAAYPKLYALLDRVGATSYAVGGAAKQFWNTKRPYVADSRIKPLIKAHDNPSYPSGHTTGSYLWADVLSLLQPKNQAAFRARAEVTAEHRVLAGMHYPHDLAGGRELALLLMGGLLQNQAFLQDLAAANAELEAAKKPAPAPAP